MLAVFLSELVNDVLHIGGPFGGRAALVERLPRNRFADFHDEGLVAVDNCFSGLIPKKELFGDTGLRIGDQVTARVVKVLEDGKLTLSVREKAYLQIQKDAEKIERLLGSYEGSLPFNDKAAPEVIAHETGMSKNEFKRAVGHLLKEGKIQITEKNIRRVRG